VTATAIPLEVTDFLSRHIDSVPQLEALLIMSEDPQSRWNEADLAARLYVPRPVAREILEALQQHDLVTRSEDGFRFGTADDKTRALVSLVARTYRSNLIPVANFIHRKASASVREFARAFDFKKDH
jgi:hypothetical protein